MHVNMMIHIRETLNHVLQLLPTGEALETDDNDICSLLPVSRMLLRHRRHQTTHRSVQCGKTKTALVTEAISKQWDQTVGYTNKADECLNGLSDMASNQHEAILQLDDDLVSNARETTSMTSVFFMTVTNRFTDYVTVSE